MTVGARAIFSEGREVADIGVHVLDPPSWTPKRDDPSQYECNFYRATLGTPSGEGWYADAPTEKDAVMRLGLKLRDEARSLLKITHALVAYAAGEDEF